MSRDKWVICFSNYWSNSYIYGIGNTVLQFHNDGYKVLWVNSIPNRNMSAKRSGGKSKLLRNVLKKLKSHLKPIKKEKNDFYVLTPFYIPFVEYKLVYKLNLHLLKFQIALVRLSLGIKNGFILFSSSMTETPFLFKKKPYLKYFQYIADLYSDYREASDKLRQNLKQREELIFNFADYLLVSSMLVVEKIKPVVRQGNKILYFPHGVDYNHFQTGTSRVELNIKHPIVGYFGSLTTANDQSVIAELANNDLSVVLIGRSTGDYSALESNPNVHFLGEIPYDQLPMYASCFDVAFMAWKPGKWIDNSNPKKTYEYLALGLPIVCQPINQIRIHLSDFVYFANTPQEFVFQVKTALSENTEDLVAKRKEIAKGVDWSTKYNMLKQLLSE